MPSRSIKTRLGRASVSAIAVVALASCLLLSLCNGNGNGNNGPLFADATTTPNPLGGGSSGGSGIVLRVRLANGSMEKLQLEPGTEDHLTLGDVLRPFGVSSDSAVRIGTSTSKTKASLSETKNLKELAIRHGSMITVLPPPPSSASNSNANSNPNEPVVSRFAARKLKIHRSWDPYPDLAKDYDSILHKTKTKRSSGQGMSYSDISKLQSSLHVVDVQKEGPLKRLYMCKVAAERFYSNGVVKGMPSGSAGASTSNKKKNSKPSFESRFGLLLGTISDERVDRKPKKARTSLSSQTSDSEYCTVAKVQAVWEPPGQSQSQSSKARSQNSNDNLYDAPRAAKVLAENPRVLVIARYLGLKPVGWIFSYQDDRLRDENSFGTDGPQALFGLDVAVAGNLKIRSMKEKFDRRKYKDVVGDGNGDSDSGDSDSDDDNGKPDRGDKFVTLAMDATTGATEAFQLSDVTVQMVHEDLFEALLAPTANVKNPPLVPTKHPVLIDGQETKVLDSVLCLVNTAVLSHVGSYSGGADSSSANAVKKSNGGMTLKTKKALVRALDSSDANDFLKAVCDFNVLLALDEMLSSSSSSKKKSKPKSKSTRDSDDNDMKVLCGLVRKWARGQKKGTVIDSKFRLKLKTYLS